MLYCSFNLHPGSYDFVSFEQSPSPQILKTKFYDVRCCQKFAIAELLFQLIVFEQYVISSDMQNQEILNELCYNTSFSQCHFQ